MWLKQIIPNIGKEKGWINDNVFEVKGEDDIV